MYKQYCQSTIKGNQILVNQQQINKFYQERQKTKKYAKEFNKNLATYNSTIYQNLKYTQDRVIQNQNNIKTLQNFFKPKNSVYRRKSLINKINAYEQSNYSSFNNSTQFANESVAQIDQPYNSQKRNDLISYPLSHNQNENNNQNSQSYESKLFKNRIFSNNTSVKYDFPEKPNEIASSKIQEEQFKRQPYFEISRRRCNSVQLSNYRNITKNSNPLKDKDKKAIPLSSILKKYEDQVKKLELQQQKINPKQNYQNKQNQQQRSNAQSFVENLRSELDAKQIIIHNNNLNEDFCYKQTSKLPLNELKSLNTLPLSIMSKQTQKFNTQVLKNPIFSNSLQQKLIKDASCQKPQVQNYKKSLQNQTFQKLQSSNIPTKNTSQQQEQIIKRQQQYIKKLQKQTLHYKKFVQSIKKMKKTLQMNDTKYMNHENRLKNQSRNNKNLEQQTNLKQLWRWIKSLPSKKEQYQTQTNKQSSKYLR